MQTGQIYDSGQIGFYECADRTEQPLTMVDDMDERSCQCHVNKL